MLYSSPGHGAPCWEWSVIFRQFELSSALQDTAILVSFGTKLLAVPCSSSDTLGRTPGWFDNLKPWDILQRFPQCNKFT